MLRVSYYLLPWLERHFGFMVQRFQNYFTDIGDPYVTNGEPNEYLVRQYLQMATVHLALAKLNGEDKDVDFGHDLDLFEALLEDSHFGATHSRLEQKQQLRQRHAALVSTLL